MCQSRPADVDVKRRGASSLRSYSSLTLAQRWGDDLYSTTGGTWLLCIPVNLFSCRADQPCARTTKQRHCLPCES